MEAYTYLSKILEVEPELLEDLDKEMAERTGKAGVLESVAEENRLMINETLNVLDSKNKSIKEVRGVLRDTILEDEKELLDFINTFDGDDEFERAVNFAKKATTVDSGFFLKRELAEQILRKREPENAMKYLGVSTVDELLSKYDVTEIFASLRFLESEEWMHKTFEEAYSNFTADDFEERKIDVRVLGPEWKEVAEKFVAKKHHNVSHLKEFGVIFLNPIKMNIPGKFLRDTALFLHYFHEISFYSKLFRHYADREDFAEKLKALLRGDVPEAESVEKGEWLIIQQYLWKIDPADKRLFLPRVNPESMHWARGERDLTSCIYVGANANLCVWYNLNWVGGVFSNGESGRVSFDLEDNAMTFVSFMNGKEEIFNYHQREAMWTKIFTNYVGGENEMEKLLIENFDKGIIKF